jgi:murein DD-endopeptidase MepM/ murein hydrolase activator NlpD
MSARSHGFGRFLSDAVVRTCVAALVCTLPGHPAIAGAQPASRVAACVDAHAVTTSPGVPRAGALFELRIAGSRRVSTAVPTVTIAGVPLVPRAISRSSRGDTAPVVGSDTVRWLAAVPIDSTTGVTVEISCGAGAAPRSMRLAVDSGRYRRERLRVAPRFAAPPDSVLAARLEREAARASAVSRAALETPMLWREPFTAPRASRVTSAFGNRRTFNGETVSWHNGTDYAGAVGTPVRAANRGVVRLTGAFYLGGNVVYLDHGAGLTTAYLHLSRTLVAEGDTVERGAVIGRTGATGRVTGPHLHFIARLGGITVDPLTLIGRW